MPSFFFDTPQTTAQTLTNLQNGVIAPAGGIFLFAGVPVTMSAASELHVLGALTTLGGRAVAIAAATQTAVTIGSTGQVTAGEGLPGEAAISYSGTTRFSLSNAGLVSGIDSAVIAGAADSGAQLLLNNVGSLLSTAGPAVSLNAGAGSISVSNSGLIQSSQGLGLLLQGATQLDNSGSIIGRDTAVRFGDANDQFVSTGTIIGDVRMGQGADLAFVSGRVQGDIDGGVGNDTLVLREIFGEVTAIGQSGDDTLVTDSGQITLLESADNGTDRVISSAEAYSLGENVEILTLRGAAREGFGNAIGNTITGNNRNNLLGGESGGDRIEGQGGRDEIYGDDSNDTLFGGAADDSIFGGIGNDTVNGGEGEDLLFGNNNNDDMVGSLGNDTMFGGKGGDLFLAGDGADTVFGGTGSDVIVGGEGGDVIAGGIGFDVFLFQSIFESDLNEGTDVISGFQSGIDRLDFSAIDANGANTGDPNFSFIGTAAFSAEAQIRFVVQGSDLVVEVNQIGVSIPEMFIRLTGISTLAAADLVL